MKTQLHGSHKRISAVTRAVADPLLQLELKWQKLAGSKASGGGTKLELGFHKLADITLSLHFKEGASIVAYLVSFEKADLNNVYPMDKLYWGPKVYTPVVK